MRADIHDGQEHKRSVQGPDTEAQDLSPPNHHFPLATRGRSIQKCHEPTLVLCGRPAGGLAAAFPSHVTLVISIINREVPSCELPASCLWSSRCWLSPVLLRPSRAPSPTSAG